MDPQTRKKVLRRIVHGVYVIGVRDESRLNAFTATWVTQVSFEPPLLAIVVRNDGVSHQMIEKSRVFVLNLLGTGQKAIAQHFLKPAHLGADKLAGVAHRRGTTGAPILEEAAAYAECRVKEIHPAGDHSIVVGEVIEVGLQKAIEPLTLQETGWHYGG